MLSSLNAVRAVVPRKSVAVHASAEESRRNVSLDWPPLCATFFWDTLKH